MDNLWPRTIDRSSSPPGQILTQPAEQQAGATNSNPSSSAVHRALELPEILSHILLQLDEPGLTESQFSTAIEDLFIFQRVSRNWNAVIQDTLKLRRIMLLEYDEETSSDRPYGARYLLDPDTPALNLHPMLPCIRMEEEKWSAYRMRTEKQLIFTMDRYPVGPLEEHHTGRWLSTCIKCTSDGRLPQHFGHEDTLEDSKVLPRRYFSSINASWRRMKLFSRPKALSVEIYLTLQQDLRGTPLCGISFGIGPGQGVLGHLYDRLESVLLRDLEDYERAQLDHFEAQDALSTALEDIEHMDAPGAELRRMREAHTEWGECHFESGDCAFCAAIDW